jgi:hypothetical protein
MLLGVATSLGTGVTRALGGSGPLVTGVPVRGWALAAAGAPLMTVTPVSAAVEETKSV